MLWHATRAAVEEGVVPGGGVALLRVRKAIAAAPVANADQAAGLKILLRAIEEPLRQIVRNGGGDPSVVVAKVKEGTGNFGYNAATEEFGDMVEHGRDRSYQGHTPGAAKRRIGRRAAAHHGGGHASAPENQLQRHCCALPEGMNAMM